MRVYKTNLKLGWLAALMLAALVFTGCGNTVDDFRQVKAGMTLEEVKDLLGEPDEVSEAKGLAGVWIYHSGGLTGEKASLTVSSVGGKVMLATINKK